MCVLISPCSPRARPAVKSRYLQTPLPEQDVLPLRIAEKDITLAHVLSLCTPPPDYPSRDRILTSVQYIVSRMAEPFNILGECCISIEYHSLTALSRIQPDG